jgi:pSer/pThr/pTyr-binding forkhead associated (FHA) protein
MIRLTLFDGEWEKSREFLEDVVTIGRSRTNVLEIKESSISRLHCEIAHANGKTLLVNHAKTNGTLLNGKPVGEAILKPGDTLLIGRVKLRFDGATSGAERLEPEGKGTGSTLKRKLLHRRRRE